MKRPNQQHGFALIMTMLVLVVVTVIGVSAMRLSFLSLATATNAQVNMLLMEAANAGLNAVTDKLAANPTAEQKTTALLGAALATPGKESVRCFSISSKMDQVGGALCDTSSSKNGADAFSARQTMFEQVSVLVPTDAAGNPQYAVTYGTDDDRAKIATGYTVEVHSTSSLPVLSADTDGSKAKACYAKINDDSVDITVTSVTDCMTDESIPFTTIVQKFCFGYSC